MSFSYNYTATVGNVKVQNVSFSLNKDKGLVTCKFDMLGVEVSDSVNNIEAKLLMGSSTKLTLEIDNPPNKWKSHRLIWDAAKELDLKGHGTQAFTLKVYDENNQNITGISGATQNITLDLDPISNNDTIVTSHNFGNSATPIIKFILSDLSSAQSMIPRVKVGSNYSTACTRQFEDGSNLGGPSRFLNLNGVKFQDVAPTLAFNNAICGITKFLRISSYDIIAPTMSAGANAYSIDLQSLKA